MADTTDYTALITSEHKNRPKFVDTVGVSVAPFVAVQNVLAGMNRQFSVDEAVGVQLDAVGLWVGVSRNVRVPLPGVYFTWRSAPLGWRSGVWKGTYDPVSGLTQLPDESYRLLIRAKIAANCWNGTIPDAYAVWANIFGPDTLIVIQDHQDMSMTVGITGRTFSAVDIALFTQGYIPLKPEGVRASYTVVPDGGPFFGWRRESAAIAGWRAGSWGTRL